MKNRDTLNLYISEAEFLKTYIQHELARYTYRVQHKHSINEQYTNEVLRAKELKFQEQARSKGLSVRAIKKALSVLKADKYNKPEKYVEEKMNKLQINDELTASSIVFGIAMDFIESRRKSKLPSQSVKTLKCPEQFYPAFANKKAENTRRQIQSEKIQTRSLRLKQKKQETLERQKPKILKSFKTWLDSKPLIYPSDTRAMAFKRFSQELEYVALRTEQLCKEKPGLDKQLLTDDKFCRDFVDFLKKSFRTQIDILFKRETGFSVQDFSPHKIEYTRQEILKEVRSEIKSLDSKEKAI